MKSSSIIKKNLSSASLMLFYCFFIGSSYSQEVPIINYSIDSFGQVELEVNSTTQHYYILKIKHNGDSVFELPTSMTIGESNSTIITEPLGHYPIQNYQVLEYPIANPFDTDGDGENDLSEFQAMPLKSPLNAAKSLNKNDGLVLIDGLKTFEDLAIKKDLVQWSEFLNGKVFLKFMIVDFYSDPKVYFINSKEYDLHNDFAIALGINYLGNGVKKGQIIYHPESISNNGTLGTYAFNYSNGLAMDFNVVQRTHELLAANMPYVKNNLSYFITENNENQYYQDSLLYQNSRVSVLFEADIYAGIDYWGLNNAEGFGFFRQITNDEIPSFKDIVLYESLPNTLSRVGGIITSAIQTPLSHVNLRAIQDDIPNAFIRNPLDNDTIANLLNSYIYFKVERDNYTIRKATLEEVNKWYDDRRPPRDQYPPLDLSFTSILPLDKIDFSMYDGYGAKCSNVATMLLFGFPENTIPNGFGVPFYYYQEFMKYNDLFKEVKTMVNDPDFIANRIIRNNMLSDFRKKVKDSEMPTWMLNDLSEMQSAFPPGTSIRCRSSSNNEDLANFSGAGLYDSKTQHPDEGHISKSIKQVYASLWNLRAFEERVFYRISHYVSSMGVLCHPNYSDEKANGVGVSTDPIYNTENTFYLNTQIGEDLITNPESNSTPEEILLNKEVDSGGGYIIVELSNLLPNDTVIMGEFHLEQMREFLSVIHNEFEQLYKAAGNPSFAMDIEYKITKDGQLIIKQARPWASFVPEEDCATTHDKLDLKIYPNPSQENIFVLCENCKLSKIVISNIQGQKYFEQDIDKMDGSCIKIPIQDLSKGVYILSGFESNGEFYASKKFIKMP